MFDNKKILIVGDIMLDTYLNGTVDRISPEAPVPIVNIKNKVNNPGGAANVALNIKNLGSEPILCSIIGNDIIGNDLKQIISKSGINTDFIIKSDNRKTTNKNRVIGNGVQISRFDEETTHELIYNDFKNLVRNLEIIIDRNNIDVILIQDYDKGVIDRNMIDKIIKLSKTENIPVIVDPKRRNFNFYKNIKLIKPNFKELKEGLGLEHSNMSQNEILDYGTVELHKRGIENIFVTLGDKGIFVSTDNGKETKFVNGLKRHISDVSGAGDTVISVISTIINSDLSIFDIANLSNIAGGIVCEEVGVFPINKDKLLKEINKLNI